MRIDADAALLVYDLTDISSFDGVEYYKKAVVDHGPRDISKG